MSEFHRIREEMLPAENAENRGLLRESLEALQEILPDQKKKK